MNDESADAGQGVGQQKAPHGLEIQTPTSSGSPPVDDHTEGHEGESTALMFLQPDARPISLKQLVVEVKGIYGGLVIVEAKCIDNDERQSAAALEQNPIELKDEQWQSLVALHQQLLHEHFDFFLASQHPSANPAMKRLAIKYDMPARMWKHGIHAFLEILRKRLPASLEHMLTFIKIAYSTMAHLYETVPIFEDTWVECLGNLGRYRMAIEDKNLKDRKMWNNTACLWYNKAIDKCPDVGRLYHHLAVLARPHSLKQLSLYVKSLACVIPFESARVSMSVSYYNLHDEDTARRRPSSFETIFVKALGILFTRQPSDSLAQFDTIVEELESDGLLGNYIPEARLKETGIFAAVSNIAALFEHGTHKRGKSKSSLRLAYEKAQTVKEKTAESNLTNGNLPPSTRPPNSDVDDNDVSEREASVAFISCISRLASAVLAIFLRHSQNKDAHPLLHVYLTFIWSLLIVHEAWSSIEDETVWQLIEKDIPWVDICSFLNTLSAKSEAITAKVQAEDFPKPGGEDRRPLLEDFVMRGQLYTRWYFPGTWFTDAMINEDDRMLELPSMIRRREERLLWLGFRIASANRWIHYDVETKSFIITDCLNESLSNMLDVATSESDVVFTPCTPSDYSNSSRDGPPCFTPGTASNSPSEAHDDCAAPSHGGSKRGQQFVSHDEVCLRLQRLQRGIDGRPITVGFESE